MRVGCSGLGRDGWLGFPSPREYAARFETAEVASTHICALDAGRAHSWAKSLPRTFRLSFVAPRAVLSAGKLDEGCLGDFLSSLGPLRAARRLGAILLRLGSRARFEPVRFEAIVRLLPDGYEWALDAPHKSWRSLRAAALLCRHDVALAGDGSQPRTANFVYVRLGGERRGEPLAEAELRGAVAALRGRAGYGYVGSARVPSAVEGALVLRGLLGQGFDAKLLRELRSTRKRGAMGIDSFAVSVPALWAVVRGRTTRERLLRALAIPSGRVCFKRSGERVVADVDGHLVELDFAKKMLRHACGDRTSPRRRGPLCKHVLRAAMGSGCLERLMAEVDDWEMVG
jgi:uncharacterized protein YecE (DUF72 family)